MRTEVPDARLVVAPRKLDRRVRRRGGDRRPRLHAHAPLRARGGRRRTLARRHRRLAARYARRGLAGLFRDARLAFVGGTLVPVGGHNVLEPAAVGTPLVVGPHTANVAADVDRLVAAGAAVRAGTADELIARAAELFADPARAAAAGAPGRGTRRCPARTARRDARDRARDPRRRGPPPRSRRVKRPRPHGRAPLGRDELRRSPRPLLLNRPPASTLPASEPGTPPTASACCAAAPPPSAPSASATCASAGPARRRSRAGSRAGSPRAACRSRSSAAATAGRARATSSATASRSQTVTRARATRPCDAGAHERRPGRRRHRSRRGGRARRRDLREPALALRRRVPASRAPPRSRSRVRRLPASAAASAAFAGRAAARALRALKRAHVILVSERDEMAGDTPQVGAHQRALRVRFAPNALVQPVAAAWEEIGLAALAGSEGPRGQRGRPSRSIYRACRDWEVELVHVLETAITTVRRRDDDAAAAKDVDLIVTTEKAREARGLSVRTRQALGAPARRRGRGGRRGAGDAGDRRVPTADAGCPVIVRTPPAPPRGSGSRRHPESRGRGYLRASPTFRSYRERPPQSGASPPRASPSSSWPIRIGIARGLIAPAAFTAIHAALAHRLARAGARLTGIYVCPHRPEVGPPPLRRRCRCRKPGPALVQRAVREHDLDLGRSYFVGDSAVHLGLAAAVARPPCSVSRGHGRPTAKSLAPAGVPAHIAANFRAAAEWIIDDARRRSRRRRW